MADKNGYQWPNDYPHNVPPDDSVSAEGKFYRLVDKFPPSESDFLMTREEHPLRAFDTPEKITKSYGVSFYTQEYAIRSVSMFRTLKHKKIAHGSLCKGLGTMSASPDGNSHVTLWKCVGSQPHSCAWVPVEAGK